MAYGKTLKSKYDVRNPAKYLGDSSNIICRSSWEYFFCNFLDESPMVDRWASEEVAIPYISPKDGRDHRYFIDFFVVFKDGRKVFIEIKPHAQTLPPEPPKKRSRKAESRYCEEAMIFQVNQAKWASARNFAEYNGAKFEVFTEHHLKKLGMPL